MKTPSTLLVIGALIGGMVGCGEVSPPARYNLTTATARLSNTRLHEEETSVGETSWS